MREREFINVAWFSGESRLRILTRHIFPYIAGWSAANFINTVLVGIATESALAVIGLSSAQQATLGTMIYWALEYQALLAERYVWVGPQWSRSCFCSSACSCCPQGCRCGPRTGG
jgi:peptide/nickel transport system permease protein